jgi:hypothetical protein
VLKALVSTQGHHYKSSEYKRLSALSMQLIIRRSFPEIRRRVENIKYVFEDELVPRIRSWEPEPDETLDAARITKSKHLLSRVSDGDMWVTLYDLANQMFDKYAPEIPKDSNGNRLLNINNAPAWLEVFFTVWHMVCQSVRLYRDGDGELVGNLQGTLELLYWFIYSLSEFLQVIFDVPSLFRILKSLRRKPRSKGMSQHHVAPQEGTLSSKLMHHTCLMPYIRHACIRRLGGGSRVQLRA